MIRYASLCNNYGDFIFVSALHSPFAFLLGRESRVIDALLIHEMTHSLLNQNAPEYRCMRETIMGDGVSAFIRRSIHEGLAIYAQAHLAPIKSTIKMKISRTIRRVIARAIEFLAKPSEAFKKLLVMAELRKLTKRKDCIEIIAANPEKFAPVLDPYTVGARYIADLAERFNGPEGIFEHIINSDPPTFEELIRPMTKN